MEQEIKLLVEKIYNNIDKASLSNVLTIVNKIDLSTNLNIFINELLDIYKNDKEYTAIINKTNLKLLNQSYTKEYLINSMLIEIWLLKKGF